jgi:hypothetical protein
LVVVIFLAARVPTRPTAALILPPLLLLCGVGLHRNARRELSPHVLDGVLGRIRPYNVIVLSLIPTTAIVFYGAFRALGLLLPTNVVLYVITMPLGFWLFFRSLWLVFHPGITDAAVSPLESWVDWAKKGFSCDRWIDAPGRQCEAFNHATDELIIVLEAKTEFEVAGMVYHLEIRSEHWCNHRSRSGWLQEMRF